MNWKEDLLAEFDMEFAGTRKALERVPEGKNDWQPHPKSMTIWSLANHLAHMPGWTAATVRQSELDIAPVGQPPYKEEPAADRAGILALFDRNVAEGRAALGDLTEADMDGPWSLLMGGQAIFTMPRRTVLRTMILSHNVHHRAQLGVFLRMNDLPVPSSYGPTADEQ
jgi:uncharacterized damage-inducible protein DinB